MPNWATWIAWVNRPVDGRPGGNKWASAPIASAKGHQQRVADRQCQAQAGAQAEHERTQRPRT